MTNIFLKRSFKTYLTEALLSSYIGEFEIKLNSNTESDMGWILIEQGTSKEESIFYHRRNGNSVFAYNVNRTNPNAHDVQSNVLLVNTVDYMNYIFEQTNEHLYIYKKSNSHLICKGGIVYVGGEYVTINDLDTELALTNKTLIPNELNYIYIDQTTKDFKITIIEDTTNFLVATVDVDLAGVITTINRSKILSISSGVGVQGPQGPIGPQGPQGLPGLPGADGVDGTVLPLPNYTISNDTTDRAIDLNSTNAGEVMNVLATLYRDIKQGLEYIGYRGESITGISLLSTVGIIKTYRITFDTLAPFDFTVTDGSGGDMYKADNLLGLTDYLTARTNLDVYSKGEVDALIPIVSGVNTGDETETSIKTKLGITSISGVNTGDQDLSSYLTIAQAQGLYGLFGGGTDGDVTITTTVTLTKDMFYNNLTINSGGILIPNGYRIFVKGTLLINSGGVIRYNGMAGGNASGTIPGNGGGALNEGTIGIDNLPGKTGGAVASVGINGDSVTDCFTNVNGVSGGASGGSYYGGPIAGGTGGTSTRGTNYNLPLFNYIDGYYPAYMYGQGATSGSGAGSNISINGTPAAGGGSGSNGGVIMIFAKTINSSGAIEVKGGNGGNGGNAVYISYSVGGGGGGGAGSGGIIYLVYRTLTSLGTITLTGGTGGTGGTGSPGDNGSNGSNGNSGVLIQVKV